MVLRLLDWLSEALGEDENRFLAVVIGIPGVVIGLITCLVWWLAMGSLLEGVFMGFVIGFFGALLWGVGLMAYVEAAVRERDEAEAADESHRS